MKALVAVVKNTFKEAIRDRVMYVIVIFGVVLVVASLLLYDLSLRQDIKMIKDFGLASISLFGIIVTLFLGSNMVFKEIDKKTIYLVLSKPIKRYMFLIGKFLGLSLVLLCITAFLTIIFYAVLMVRGESLSSLFLLSIFFSYLEMLFLNSFVIFFSTFASPILATFLSIGVFILGHTVDSLLWIVEKTESIFVERFCTALYYVLPNFELLNFKNQVVYGISISLKHGLFVFGYAVFYIIFILFVSSRVFQKKEF